MSMLTAAYLAALLALAVGIALFRRVLAAPTSTPRANEIAAAIRAGAGAFLSRQYRTVALVGVPILFVIGVFLNWWYAGGFLLGATASALAGFVGMNVSVRANVRVAQAARSGFGQAFALSFQGGAVTGLMVVGLGLLSLAAIVSVMHAQGYGEPDALIGLAFGGSLISVFARLGGGIFTKGADVGADLVGKVEANIPEDDPRNPAVIADNVGDNVGDCAGMAADLFETYGVTAAAAMLLAHIIFPGDHAMFLYPLAVGAAGIAGTLVSLPFVRISEPAEGEQPAVMRAMYRGLAISTVVMLVLVYLLNGQTAIPAQDATGHALSGGALWLCAVLGAVVTAVMMWITDVYTGDGSRFVERIAKASQGGHGTNVISGLAVGMQATVVPVVVIVLAILFSHQLAGLYGVGIAAMTMLSLAGIVVAIDAYGPITDNAGGIAEMAELGDAVRHVTDPLDAFGNTTKAVTKGYAIASAGLAAVVLFATFIEDLKRLGGLTVSFDLSQHPGAAGPLHRRDDPLHLRLLRDERGQRGGRARRRRGAPPVPGDPGHHGGHRQARLPHLRRHRDAGRAAPDGGAGADPRRDPDPGGLRAGHGRARAGRAADRLDRLRRVRRALDDDGRRRLGQRQEVHRARRLRRQGLGRAQGGGDRRHGGRPVQGHGRPRHQPDAQAHQRRRAAADPLPVAPRPDAGGAAAEPSPGPPAARALAQRRDHADRRVGGGLGHLPHAGGRRDAASAPGGVSRGLAAGRAALAGRGARERRAGRHVPARGRRLRLPARGIPSAGRLPGRLARLLRDLSRHDRDAGGRLRELGGAPPSGWVPSPARRSRSASPSLVSAVNYVGVRWGARVNNLTSYAKIAALLAFALLGPLLGSGSAGHLLPLVSGAGAISLAALGLAFSPILFSYLGWNASIYVASEIERPERNVPASLFLGLGICTLLYMVVNAVYLFALPIDALAREPNTGEAAAHALFGPVAGSLVAGFVVVSILGTLNATVLVGPRIAYAMALDDLFPGGVDRAHPRFATPHRAIVLQAIVSAALIAFLETFQRVLDSTTFAILLASIADVLALFALRRRQPERPRPYRALGYPWVPALYVIASAAIAVAMLAGRPLECAVGLACLASGLPFYALFTRSRAASPPAC